MNVYIVIQSNEKTLFDDIMLVTFDAEKARAAADSLDDARIEEHNID